MPISNFFGDVFGGFGMNTGVATTIFQWIGWIFVFVLICGGIGWLIWYRSRHPWPVEVIDLRTTRTGEFGGIKKRDKAGIFRKNGVPYLHLMRRFWVRHLREPLPHERDFDGEITILQITDNFYTYAPSRLYLIKRVEDAKEIIEGTKSPEILVKKGNVLMKPNPDFDPGKPLGNPSNKKFIEVDDPSVEFTEALVKNYIDESQKDAFRSDFRNVLETTVKKRDNTPILVAFGLFLLNAIVFIIMMALGK